MSGPVDVVVVSYKQREHLLACCRSASDAGVSTRLIVVDNASGDGSPEAVRHEFPDARVLELADNLGFAAAVNRGVAAGEAPSVLLLNNDARLQPGALSTLLRALDAERVAAAGPRVEDLDGHVELTVGRTLTPLNDVLFKVVQGLYRDGGGAAAALVERYHARSRQVRSLSAACLLVRRQAFADVGGFDERFFLYAEDVDFCRRLRQRGWLLRYVPEAVVVHDRGTSGALDPRATAAAWRRSQLAFYDKHHGRAATAALRCWHRARALGRRLAAGGGS